MQVSEGRVTKLRGQTTRAPRKEQAWRVQRIAGRPV